MINFYGGDSATEVVVWQLIWGRTALPSAHVGITHGTTDYLCVVSKGRAKNK